MKVEFNGYIYNIGNKTGQVACSGCVINGGRILKCPTDSEGSCILPLDKIYIDANFLQIFKL